MPMLGGSGIAEQYTTDSGQFALCKIYEFTFIGGIGRCRRGPRGDDSECKGD